MKILKHHLKTKVVAVVNSFDEHIGYDTMNNKLEKKITKQIVTKVRAAFDDFPKWCSLHVAQGFTSNVSLERAEDHTFLVWIRDIRADKTISTTTVQLKAVQSNEAWADEVVAALREGLDDPTTTANIMRKWETALQQ